MTELQHLKEIAEWDAVWLAQKEADAAPLLIFKRAPTCATARVIERTFTDWLDSLPAAARDRLRVVAVDVIEQRPVARKVAQDTLIPHESPQALLFGPRRKRIWNASHWQIERVALEAALKKVL
ncbi:MAG: DUF2847 family protein [Planctomycetes bacterium]|nr:DUF2847 family protein [Planctomycetota bacterium]